MTWHFWQKILKCLQFATFCGVIVTSNTVRADLATSASVDVSDISTAEPQNNASQYPTTASSTTRFPFSKIPVKNEALYAIVPGSVQFLCNYDIHDVAEESYIRLDHNNVEAALVTIFWNGSISSSGEDRFSLSGTSFGLRFDILSVSVEDAGRYSCYWKSSRTSPYVEDNKYTLVVDAPAKVLLNDSLLPIYLEVYDVDSTLMVSCTAAGNPAPTAVAWNPVGNFQSGRLSISKISPGETYTYNCSACNKLRNEVIACAWNVLQVKVNDSKPSKVESFESLNVQENSAAITWTPGDTGKANAISIFEVRKNNESGVSLNGTKRSHTFSDLQPFTNYSLYIRACTIFGCSNESYLHVRTLEQARPTEPSNISSSVTARSITITFVPGRHASKNSTFSYTVLTCRRAFDDSLLSIRAEGSEAVFAELLAYTEYKITMRSCINGSDGTPICSTAVEVPFTRTEMDVPSSPQNVSAVNTMSDDVQILVTWERPVYINAPNVSYYVRYNATGDNLPRVLDTNLSSTTFESTVGNLLRNSSPLIYLLSFPDIKPDVQYSIQIIAKNDISSSYSRRVDVVTDVAVPDVPLNLRLRHRTEYSLTVAWDPPADFGRGMTYRVHAFNNTRGDIPVEAGGNLEVTIRYLEKNTLYEVRVYGQVERASDKRKLTGKSTTRLFWTAMPVKPTTSPSVTVVTPVAVSIIMLVLILAAIFGAIYYCRTNGIFAVSYKSTFYVEKETAFGLRASMRIREPKHLAMNLTEFAKHVEDMHANSDYLFSEEFASLGPNRPNQTCESSTAGENIAKNRFRDIVAYDHSRVRLMSVVGVPGSNYINANFIDGYHMQDAYIATQAPMIHTIVDFWRMCWENNSRVIVMLTKLVEGGKRKCDQYWPDEGTTSYKDFHVTLQHEYHYANYVEREFSLVKGARESVDRILSSFDTRLIRQFHFTEWPDFGVPRDRASVTSFVLRVRKHMADGVGPPVIHCSAGVGRTGTFILLDAMMRRVDHRQDVDVYNFLKRIRSQRNFLVQQESQYIFVHDCLLDYFVSGVTEIRSVDLDITLNHEYWQRGERGGISKIEREWELVNKVVIPTHFLSSAQKYVNRSKNRDQSIIPGDASRVRLLMKAGIDGSDYINASYADSFYHKKAFIVTQAPLEDTIAEFWRMIWENNSQIIINLMTLEEMSTLDGQGYLPTELSSISVSSFVIEVHHVREESNYTCRTLSISSTYELVQKRTIYHYHFYSWPADHFPRMAFLVNMIRDVNQVQEMVSMECGSRHFVPPITVHCLCGAGRSGLFCALVSMKEQIEDRLQIVDVFTTVRTLQNQRPSMLQTLGQYEYLYKTSLSLKTSINIAASSGDV